MSEFDFLHAGAVDLALPASDRDGVLAALAARLTQAHPALGVDAGALTRALASREALGSTAIGHAIAVPHCKLEGVDEITGVFGRTAAPVEFGARDGAPVQGFFLIVSPIAASGPHIRVLAAISRLARDEVARTTVLESDDPAAVIAAIQGAPS